MSSLSNIEKHLQEQHSKKRRVDDLEEKPENAKLNELYLPKTMEADKNIELETSIIMVDLPPSSRGHRMPAELNCQIFYCLNLRTRRKFILGLGWDFYAMFRQILLIKSKRLCNPQGNEWSRSSGDATISEDGLVASNNTNTLQTVYAEKGFPISFADCRTDDFPGTICYYYEVKSLSGGGAVGLIQNGNNVGILLGKSGNTYAMAIIATNGSSAGLSEFSELPVEARTESNVQENVYGCGILMYSDNKVITFFTLNGILLGQQSLSPSVDRLAPAISIWENVQTFEANFGDDKDKPFQYDIRKCPGMGLDCI